MAITALITGFGPFPGAPFNPTGPLVGRLARLRRPGLADVKIIPYVFPTSYAAVDSELPKLIAKYKPDMVLMFGLAPRARTVRVETRARNALALLPDVSGRSLGRSVIAPGAPSAMSLLTPARHLLAAFRTAHVPTTLSRDAGRPRASLMLAPGVYRAGGLTLPAGAQLIGVRGATRLVLTNGPSLLSAEGSDTITVSGVTFDGSRQPSPPNRGLLHLTETKNVRIADCTFDNPGGNGITLERCSGHVT